MRSMWRVGTPMRASAIIGLAAATGALAAGCTGPTRSTSVNAQGSSSPTPTVANPFTVTARFSAASLGLHHPPAFAIGPNGDLYITDTSDRVTVVSPAGKVLDRWGGHGKGPGRFAFTFGHAGIAVSPDGTVYVSDSGNCRIQVLSPAGRFIRQFGGCGSGEGQFLAAFMLAVDPAGNVYVADDDLATLSKFSPTGQFEWRVGGPAEDVTDLRGSLFYLSNVDSHGRVVVAMGDTHRIVYLDARGHVVESFQAPDACNVTVDAAGDTVLAVCTSSDIHTTLVFDRTHHLVGEWRHTPFGPGGSPRFGPRGEVFAIASDGTVLKLSLALPGA
jgi:sugar lactone lactonase YvrE